MLAVCLVFLLGVWCGAVSVMIGIYLRSRLGRRVLISRHRVIAVPVGDHNFGTDTVDEAFASRCVADAPAVWSLEGRWLGFEGLTNGQFDAVVRAETERQKTLKLAAPISLASPEFMALKEEIQQSMKDYLCKLYGIWGKGRC